MPDAFYVVAAGRSPAEHDYQINEAMKALYRQGCRRMRAIRLPKTGDWTRYRVMGWVV